MRRRKDFPVNEVRRFLEPGPVVLMSTAHQHEQNIMTMGWHMIMGFSPSLVGTYIWNANHSHDLARKSEACVINVPTVHMATQVTDIGNCSGRDTDKFVRFGLTAVKAEQVSAPLIEECHASFECKLFDDSQIGSYNLFIWEVVKAHVAPSPKYPETLHYRGDGVFMTSGQNTARYRRRFKPEML